jgi:4-hydroxy-4-methyl-2-oxoglutarate aldolase
VSRDPLVDRLAALDTCAVSDALERHGLQGALLGLQQVGADRPAAGRAVTVDLGPAGVNQPMRHLGTAAVDASGPGQVIIVANRGRIDCAAWGGLLSIAAALRGIEGVVVDGACRDVHEALAVGLPVSARAAVPVTARGRVVELGWGAPVVVGTVMVAPGDLVLSDRNGVVVVPEGAADDVVETATEIHAHEAAMATALRDGRPVSEVMGRPYETLIDAGARDA